MGDRLPDREGIADREHYVPNLERVGVSKLERREAFVLRSDAQHREIRARIFEHHVGLEFALVRERHLDLVCSLDDVVVGDDQARGVDENARAERALHRVSLPARRAGHSEEAAKDGIVK